MPYAVLKQSSRAKAESLLAMVEIGRLRVGDKYARLFEHFQEGPKYPKGRPLAPVLACTASPTRTQTKNNIPNPNLLHPPCVLRSKVILYFILGLHR